jgi:spermidine/putrescine transport system ATP-binding protein
MEAHAQGDILLEGLTKSFDEVVAVHELDLHMPSGEFFTLLGPSGCGKTTTLRMIAGFERPTGGRILLDGVDVAQVAPHKRNVNTVFQSYALFPHLDVASNVAFGLKYQRLTKEERRRRVAEALDMVQLGDYGRRRPSQLSGGQQQRVALARALVLKPRVLLLDEPLGALDARLRKNLQVELKALQSDVGITFVFVTHDQDEALTMSDRLAVMNAGRVEQAGSPREVYEEPTTVFVADFLGASNLFAADAVGGDRDGCMLRVSDRSFRACQGDTAARGDVRAMIRPERIAFEPHGTAGENRMPGLVERSIFHGGSHEVHVRVLGGDLLKATITNDGEPGGVGLDEGAAVTVHLPADALRILRSSPVAAIDPEAAEPEPEAAPA